MEKEAWRLLRTLSAKIPSVRIPIASLSGGQRQTVAIARSLVGAPKVVMLDEPTAALGVAQTAEVLNLIERLRETGLGVILVSHNMADVQAVADRIVVTAAGSQRRGVPRRGGHHRSSWSPPSPGPATTSSPPAPRGQRMPQTRREPRMSDVKDPDADDDGLRGRRRHRRRAAHPQQGPGRHVAHLFWNRLKGGELGTLPVIVGLIVICAVFYAREPAFLSSRSLVSMTQFAAPTGIIALGIVLVLLLGEIDLSVGSVAGFTSAIMAVMVVNNGAVARGGHAGRASASGWRSDSLYAVLHQVVGVPSFVFSLAGLLAFQGALLYILGDQGTITLPQDSALARVRPRQVPHRRPGLHPGRDRGGGVRRAHTCVGIRRRQAAGLTPPSLVGVLVKAALHGGRPRVLLLLPRPGDARGVGYLFTFFVLLVVLMDLLLRKTTWGRHVHRRRWQRGGGPAVRHQGRADLHLRVRGCARRSRHSAGCCSPASSRRCRRAAAPPTPT